MTTKKCLHCGADYKQKHKYHFFCSKPCKFKNYHSPNRVVTEKLYEPIKKEKSLYFDWAEYPDGV